jgi:hypothetical protein
LTQQENAVDLITFRTLFEGSIRAIIDFSELERQGLGVTSKVIDRPGIGDLLTVWYLHKDGTKGKYHDPESSPMTIAEAVVNQQAWPAERLAEVLDLKGQFDALTEPVVLMVPVQRVGESFIILDATHRLSAAFLSSASVRVLLLALDEPDGELASPDVVRWRERLDAQTFLP